MGTQQVIPIEFLRAKTRRITALETTTMVEWLIEALEAVRRNSITLARLAAATLDTGLDAEHFEALLDADIGARSDDEKKQLAEFVAKFEEAKAAFQRASGPLIPDQGAEAELRDIGNRRLGGEG